MPDDTIEERPEPDLLPADGAGDLPEPGDTVDGVALAGLPAVPAEAGSGDGDGDGGVAAGEAAPKPKSKGKSKGKGGKGKSGKAKQPKDVAVEVSPLPEPVVAPAAALAAPRAGGGVAGVVVGVVLAAVAVGLAVALVLTTLSLGNQQSLDAARTSALTAARADAADLAGYDYRDLEANFQSVLAVSTPSFRASYRQSTGKLEPTLVKYHATATAKVVAAGLVSATTSQAVALVFVDQTVTNSEQSGSTTDRVQIEITLVASGGAWLINQVTLL